LLSWERYAALKELTSPEIMLANYMQQPIDVTGRLYSELKTYEAPPSAQGRALFEKIVSYTDTADTGEDYLCSICYRVGRDGLIYVTDVVHTPLGMEFTEEAVAGMFVRNDTRLARIESNNGGRGFARNVAKLCPAVKIEPFTQSANKESRILTNAPTVLKHILFPADWAVRWPELYAHLTTYRRTFRSNRWHDAADVLTGIVEFEIVNKIDRRVRSVGFGR
jgi:predicted phage terminase large subunit-like protein